MQEINVTSTLDNTPQPNLFHPCDGTQPRPLLVGLHTWSADRFNQVRAMQPLAEKRNWNLLLPEFRGPNITSNARRTQAGGSRLAQQDILDAVAFAREKFPVSDKIFLLGGSGGGHMSLLMAAAAPKLWTAVSSWCPITDLRAWRLQNKNYRPGIEWITGGAPEDSAQVAAEYDLRSPISHLEKLAASTLSIHHGKSDASVPFTHTLKLYTQLMEKFPKAEVYCEIFPGGHEIHTERGVAWFDTFLKDETAAPKLTG